MQFKLIKRGVCNMLISGNKADCLTSLSDRTLEKIGIFKPGIEQDFVVSTEKEEGFHYCFSFHKEINPTIVQYVCNKPGVIIEIWRYGLKEFFGCVPEKFYIKEIL